MTDAEIKKLKKDYLNGMKYNEIFEKYNITENELKQIIYKYKLKRNKSKAQIGNTNAVGNSGGPGAEPGNKRALTTGEYEDIFSTVFSEQEVKIYKDYEIENKEKLLKEEYKILTIREMRMLNRIKILQDKDKDLTIGSIRKRETKKRATVETETITEAECTINIIQKIEEGLTRVQDAKRKCIETLHKMNIDDKRLEIDLSNMDGEEIEDTSETDADIYGS